MVRLTCKDDYEVEQNMIAVNRFDAGLNNLRNGCPVVILGKKKTVAQLVVDDANQGSVSMNATMRINANVKDGDEVEIQELPGSGINRGENSAYFTRYR